MNITEVAPDAWLCVGKTYAANSLVLSRGNEALLIEPVCRASISVFYARLALCSILDIHIAADDGFGSSHEWLGID